MPLRKQMDIFMKMLRLLLKRLKAIGQKHIRTGGEMGMKEHICARCGCEVENGIDLYDKCMYEAQVEMEEYNRMYEPTYNPEDGSM